MIDLLVLIETLIYVALASRIAPEDIPIVRFCMLKTICFQN